jgi:hypothetical protein
MIIDGFNGFRGKTVKIFTARVCGGYEAVRCVKVWLRKYGLPDLEVTNVNDFDMIELWDDRVIKVVTNTGDIVEVLRKNIYILL